MLQPISYKLTGTNYEDIEITLSEEGDAINLTQTDGYISVGLHDIDDLINALRAIAEEEDDD